MSRPFGSLLTNDIRFPALLAGDGHGARDVSGPGERGAAVWRAEGQGHLQVSAAHVSKSGRSQSSSSINVVVGCTVPTARWKSSSERCLLASGLHALCNVYPVYARASLHASHAAHGKLWFLLACRVLDSPDTMTSAKLIERIVANRAQFEQRQVRLGERVAKSACFGTASRPACCCCCCCYYHFLRCRRCRLTTPAAAGACNCMCANRITARGSSPWLMQEPLPPAGQEGEERSGLLHHLQDLPARSLSLCSSGGLASARCFPCRAALNTQLLLAGAALATPDPALPLVWHPHCCC